MTVLSLYNYMTVVTFCPHSIPIVQLCLNPFLCFSDYSPFTCTYLDIVGDSSLMTIGVSPQSSEVMYHMILFGIVELFSVYL